MTEPPAASLAREFWRLMASNDFQSVAAVLDSEFVMEWPQSKERIRGAQDFGRMNHEYEAHGRWQFDIVRLFGNESEAVSEVDITDGTQRAKAISFFTVREGRIIRLVEYWPEAYVAPTSRAHLVESMD